MVLAASSRPPASSRYERSPLLPTTASSEPSLGTARFPHHPRSPVLPLWRKLLLRFFDGHESIDTLNEDDVWPLAPPLDGARVAEKLRQCIPATGRVPMLRAVWAVYAARFRWIWTLDVVATAIAVLRPLLLEQLYWNGLMKLVGPSERRLWGAEACVAAPLVGIFAAELALTIVNGQRRLAADDLHFHVNRGLFTLIVDRFISSEEFTSAPASLGLSAGDGRVGHKQRLTEIADVLATDLLRASYFLVGSEDTLALVVRLTMSLIVLVRIAGFLWKYVCIAVGAYAVTVAVGAVVNAALGGAFYSAVLNRVNTIREFLKGIHMVKLNGWEKSIERKIHDARASETSRLKRLAMVMILLFQVLIESPMLLAAALLGVSCCASRFGEPTVILAYVFTGLILFDDVVCSAGKVVQPLHSFVIGVFAWSRIERIIQPPLKPNEPSNAAKSTVPRTASTEEDTVFEMQGVCIKHKLQVSSSIPLLVNVDWRVRKGELVIIHGATGVGKSTLLAATRDGNSIVQLSQGSFHGVSSKCRVAYCTQEPWLQTLSIRENILFGSEFNEEKYWKIVDACGLLEDLSILPSGDATVVGPRGINLAGGQSARIALARACYADADLYLLDCPLANVDAIVQSEIFRKCIVDLLMFKTVVIVTHNPEYIGSSYVDQLVEVKSLGVHTRTRHLKQRGDSTSERRHNFISRRMRDDRDATVRWSRGESPLKFSPLAREDAALVRRIILLSSQPQVRKNTLTEDDSFTVSWTPIKEYARSGGCRSWIWFVSAGAMLIMWGVVCIARDVRITSAASETTDESAKSHSFDETTIRTYGHLVATSIALGFGMHACVFAANSVSAGRLFSIMTHAVIHAPMTFFYNMSTGVVINRFYGDMAMIDSQLPTHVSSFLLSSVVFIGRALVLSWLLGPLGLAVTVIGHGTIVRLLSIAFFSKLSTMMNSAREQQLNFMSEVLDGEAVLRAFGEESLLRASASLQATKELNDRIRYVYVTFNSYTVLREEIALASLGLAYTAVLAVSPITQAELLLVLLYVLMMQNEFFMKLATAFVNVFIMMDTIERLHQYGTIKPESDSGFAEGSLVPLSSSPASDEWPSRGEIVFESVRFAYVDHPTNTSERLALYDVSFSLKNGETVGVIGRTGSGKSSLAMALLRVHPLRSGRILLDGVDLRTVPLSQLRRSITMIPQSPTFYRCSVRDYLDPFHEFDDARLWSELLTVKLGSRVQSLEEELLDNGENWSLGQRQLLCFARALLKPSRVVVLDESFSCVDQSCQEKILRIVRERMSMSTVILITHRLDQILAFDRILVMSRGRLVESGSASELASDPESVFYEFLESSLLTF